MGDGRDLSTCRLFTGYLPGYLTCTSQVELDAAHRSLWFHLASVSRFSVALDQAAVDVLAGTIEHDGVCAVPCRHERRGRVLLGVHPFTDPGVVPYADRDFNAGYAGGSMRVYLYLDATDDNRIEITFTRSVLTSIVDHLRSCRSGMAV